MQFNLSARRAVLACALATFGQMAGAAVVINTPFLNLENRNINSLGFAVGATLRFGAVNVFDNPDLGTTITGLATTTNTTTGVFTTRVINPSPSPLNPNFYSRSIAIDPGLRGPWTLNFTNGTDTAQRVLSLPAGASILPFVNSVTLGGTSDHPTFNWTPPSGVTVNAYRINIYDRSLINLDPLKGPINTGQVMNRDVKPDQTSYTVTESDFSVAGYGFKLGTNYSIEISAIQTKDGSTNSNNTNLASISRAYADFTPRESGGQEVVLPVTNVGGAFVFDVQVVAGETYYIDPLVATGYDYAIGLGDPNFRSVSLPFIGDGLFDIFGFDAFNNLIQLADDFHAGDIFDFGASGVSRFRVTGIETSAGLDPDSPTAFVTGLTFTGAGRFTGTQTPLVVQVPEPGSFALLILGVAGLVVIRKRKLP